MSENQKPKRYWRSCQYLSIRPSLLPNEDLSKYPRPFENDKKLLDNERVDYLFYPDAAAIYPPNFQTYVTINKLQNILDGKSRPEHFSAMATIVLKLFNLILPTNAYFGQKDFRQSVVIKQMVKDLNLPIKINVAPTYGTTMDWPFLQEIFFKQSRRSLFMLNLYHLCF